MNKLFQKTPDDWNIIKLKDAINLSSGKVRPKDYSLSKSQNYQYPIYGGNGILGYSESFLIDFETIIIGRVGEYCGSIHFSNSSSWISDNAMYVNKFLRNDLDKYFLANILELLKLNRFKKRAGQPLISQNIVYSQSIPIPQIKEQNKISSIIKNVNKILIKIQSVIENLQILKKGLMQRLLTEGIGHAEFKETRMGKIPKEWKIIDFNKSILKTKHNLDSLKTSEYEKEGKYPIIDQSMEYIAGYSNREDLLYRDNLPVIIFGDHTRNFKFIDFKFICGADGTKILNPNKILFDPLYFYYFYSNLKIKNLGYSRHFKLLKEMQILKPELDEQQKISEILGNIDNQIRNEQKFAQKIKKIKKGLLQDLLTGKKRVKTN